MLNAVVFALRDEAGEGLGWLVLVMADGASGGDGV